MAVACLLDDVVPGPRCRSDVAGRLVPVEEEEAAAAAAAEAAAAAALADGAMLGTCVGLLEEAEVDKGKPPAGEGSMACGS